MTYFTNYIPHKLISTYHEIRYLRELQRLFKGIWTANEEFPCFINSSKSNTLKRVLVCVILHLFILLIRVIVVTVVVDCDENMIDIYVRNKFLHFTCRYFKSSK